MSKNIYKLFKSAEENANSLFPEDLSNYMEIVTKEGLRYLSPEEGEVAIALGDVIEASNGKKYEISEMLRRISFKEFYFISGMYLEDRDYFAAKENEDIITCTDCGTEMLASLAKRDINDLPLCQKCFNKKYFVCAECGNIHKITKKTAIVDGKRYCEDCLSRNFYMCDSCGKYHRNLTSTTNETDIKVTVGKISLRSPYFVIEKWCPECISKYSAICPNCQTRYSTKNFTENFMQKALLKGEYGYCPKCLTSDSRYIIGYYEKPSGLFFYKDDVDGQVIDGHSNKLKETIFYGVEMEMDAKVTRGRIVSCAEDTARYLTIMRNDVYAKHDGSVDDGIEIITRPCSIERHLETDLWDEINNTAINFKMRGHDSLKTGYHIHISRAPFKNVEEYGLKFIHAFEMFWDDWVKFSRRTSEQLHWCKKYNLSDEVLRDRIDSNQLYCHGDHNQRYFAVNLTNDKTIEIRIFRASLKTDTVKATLWCVSNLSERIRNGFDPATATSFRRLFELEKAPKYVIDYMNTRKV